MKNANFYFDFSCPYAYLASTQLQRLADRSDASITLKPMLLGGVFRALEVPQNLASTLGPAKARHNMADLQRHADLWDVPYQMPAGHPFRTVEALRAMLVVGAPFDDLMHRFYRAYWVDGLDIGRDEIVVKVLDEAGHDGQAVLEATQRSEVKTELRVRTDEALVAGVFGAPAFGVEGKLYWGQDRIEEVARALNPALPASVTATSPICPVDFYFDFSSPFAALGAQKVEAVFGAAATWRPMLLGAVFKATGMVNLPIFAFSLPKRRWAKDDLDRQAAALEFPYRWPSRFPMNSVLPLRVTLQLQEAGHERAGAFILRVFRAYWVEDRNISEPDVVADICHELGFDGGPYIQGASEPSVKSLLRAATAQAVEAGVFGAPTTVVHRPGKAPELFWGADRMELARQYAADGTLNAT